MDINYNTVLWLKSSVLTFDFGIPPPHFGFFFFLISGYNIIIKSVFSSLIIAILQIITFTACFTIGKPSVQFLLPIYFNMQ